MENNNKKIELKKDYQKPEIIEINGLNEVESMPACENGSGNIGMCTTGSSAGFSCDSGSGAV